MDDDTHEYCTVYLKPYSIETNVVKCKKIVVNVEAALILIDPVDDDPTPESNLEKIHERETEGRP